MYICGGYLKDGDLNMRVIKFHSFFYGNIHYLEVNYLSKPNDSYKKTALAIGILK